jgi:hypothetical protein
MSEEALNGIKMMYQDQNTNSCLLEREMTAAGVFAPSIYPGYNHPLHSHTEL